MGAVGGILYLGVAAVLYPNSKTAGLDHVNYQPLFIVVSAIMFVAVAVLFLTIREPKLTAENQALEKQHPEWNLAQDDGSGHETLPKPVKKSLGFLLASIALWFIGYNGVTTWFSTYVDVVMGQGLGGASTCLLIATAGAIVSYIPIGQIASKIGRKRTIQCGIILLGRLLRQRLCAHNDVLVHQRHHVRRLRPRRALHGLRSTSTRFPWSLRCARDRTSANSQAITTRPPWLRRSLRPSSPVRSCERSTTVSCSRRLRCSLR